MKIGRSFRFLTIVLGIVSTLALVASYLAQHDIFHDYVSPEVLSEEGVALDSFPTWTHCRLEWRMVGVCFWLMVAFHLVFLVSLLINRVPEEESNS